SQWAAVAALALSLPALAQRPDESALFGAAPDAGPSRGRPSPDAGTSRGRPTPDAGTSRGRPGPDAGTPRGRPSEEAMVGAPGAGSPAAREAGRTSGAPGSAAEESRGLDQTPSSDAFATGRVKENPLSIGGLFYTRGFLSVAQDQPFNQSRVSLPTLVDVYL